MSTRDEEALAPASNSAAPNGTLTSHGRPSVFEFLLSLGQTTCVFTSALQQSHRAAEDPTSTDRADLSEGYICP